MPVPDSALANIGAQNGNNIAAFWQGFSQPPTQQDDNGNAQTPTFAQRWLGGQRAAAQGGASYIVDADKAKALRNVIKAYAQDEPDPDKQDQIIAASHVAGLGDLEGMVQAHANALNQQKTQADIQEQLARGKYYQSFGDAKEQAAEDSKTTGTFLQNYLTAPKDQDPETGEDVPMEPEDRLAYAAKNTPGLSGRHMPQIMDALANWQKIQEASGNAGTPLPVNVDSKKVPGYSLVTMGKSMQIVPSPDTANARIDATADAQSDRQTFQFKQTMYNNISRRLEGLYKLPPSQRNLPANQEKIREMEAKQASLESEFWQNGGTPPAAAPATGAAPVGTLDDFNAWRKGR